MKPIHLFSTLLAFASLSSGVNAGGINPGTVSEDAKWLIHYDADAARDTEIGEWMMEKLTDLERRQIKAAERLLSIDPLEGLKSVTLYGTSVNPKDAALVVRVDHDSEHVGDLFGACPRYSRDGDIHKFECRDGHSANILLWEDKYLIAASSEEGVRRAAGLVAGKGRSLKGSKLGDSLSRGNPVLTAWVNAEKLEMRGRSKMASEVKSMHYVAGEKDGKVGWFLKLEMSGDDTAEMVQKMAEGMLEYAKKHKKSDQPLIQEALAAVDSKVDGSTVYMWAAYDNDDVIEVLKKMEAKMKEYRERHKKHWGNRGHGHDHGKSAKGSECPKCDKEGCKGCEKGDAKGKCPKCGKDGCKGCEKGGDHDKGDHDSARPWHPYWKGKNDDDHGDDDDRKHKRRT